MRGLCDAWRHLFFSTATWPAESFGKVQTFFSVPFHQGSPGQDLSRGQTRIQTPCDYCNHVWPAVGATFMNFLWLIVMLETSTWSPVCSACKVGQRCLSSWSVSFPQGTSGCPRQESFMDELLACALWSFSAKFMPPACRAVAQIVRHDQPEQMGESSRNRGCMYAQIYNRILSCLHKLLVTTASVFWEVGCFWAERFCVDCLHSKAHLTWSSH